MLRRYGRSWNGNIFLAPIGTFYLSLAGLGKLPQPAAIELAKELLERFPSLIPSIENDLFEHYEPYKDAVDAGEWTGSPCPQIASASGVWSHVEPAHVRIEIMNGRWQVEIAFRTEWDIEHTVAAIFSDWQLIEFNGSV